MWSLLPGMISAQSTGAVIGIVLDASTREPLPGVTVYVNINTGTVTNESGRYSIDLTPGEYEVTYTSVGY